MQPIAILCTVLIKTITISIISEPASFLSLHKKSSIKAAPKKMIVNYIVVMKSILLFELHIHAPLPSSLLHFI